MLKNWKIYETDGEASKQFARELGISEMLAGVLLHRGIRTRETAEKFLHPEDRQEYYDPFLMKGMEAAVDRISRAIADGEKIVVYGDYDVDGISATSLLLHNLMQLGAVADFYIPDRQTEGYGFNQKALHALAENGAKLLVSVDCGISSVEDVAALKGELDIVITDHHIPGEVIPDAVAVVNPHQSDCPYPDKNLAGVGVAFKLCQALWKKLRQVDFNDGLEIVALGTIADIVPLVGENRKIVRLGLKSLQSSSFVGINSLIDVAGLTGKEIGTGQVGFQLAPRLNAAGRIGKASDGVKLLLAENRAFADTIANELNEENLHRQEIEREILALAEEELHQMDLSSMHSIVLKGEGWHPGVIGIVASRLVEEYYLPTIILSAQGDTCKGSCRSIKGLHMYEALSACSEHLLGFGGHSQAAGLSLKTEDVDAFREAFDAYAEAHLKESDYIPEVDIEFEMPPQDVTMDMIEELAKLEPYGMGNPKPLFGCRSIRGEHARAMGKDLQHLSFQMGSMDKSIKMICWNKGAYAGIVNAEMLDIVYVPQINEWQGRRSVECFLQEMQPAKREQIFPDRNLLVKIYTFLRGFVNTKKRIPFDNCMLTAQYKSCFGYISLYTMNMGLQVFQELGILYGNLEEKEYIMQIPETRLDLMQSPLYRKNMSSDRK